MKIKLILISAFFILRFSCFSQQNTSWNNLSWLTGEWKGEGSGQPGNSGGTFSFKTDLDGHVMVRKAHSEFPASNNRPAFVHDDLMIVSLDDTGNATKAIYFDNEGHTIQYTISYSPNNIVFLSEKMPNAPIFRLTYSLLDDKTINTKFEMSRDGESFMTYIEGKSRKEE